MDSPRLHNSIVNCTYWNDNNVVVLLDNDIESGQEYWDMVEANQGAE